jgi:hypothetical protein
LDGAISETGRGHAALEREARDARVVPPARSRDERRPLFWLRPVFVPLRQFLDRLLVAVAFGLWGLFFLQGWTCHVLERRGVDTSHAQFLRFLGPGLALALLAASYVWNRRRYAGAAYNFHADVLEVVEAGRRSVVPLARVISVEIQSSRAQARLDLGDVHLFLSTGPGEERTIRSLRLPDVPHPEHARARILELVEGAKHGRDVLPD